MIKKTVSAILVLLMVASIFTIIPFSASAVTDNPNYLMFQADAYSAKFNEVFVDSYSKSFAKNLYNDYRDDTVLMAAINGWEGLNILISPSHANESGMITKGDFYRAILFDVFDYSDTGTVSEQFSANFSEAKDIFKTIKNERTSYILSVIKKICLAENLSPTEINSFDFQSLSGDKKIYLSAGTPHADDVKVASDVMKIYSVGGDVLDVVTRVADYLAIRELNDSTLALLDIIINDTSNPEELRGAAEFYRDCSRKGYNKTLTALAEGAKLGFEKAVNNIEEEIWTEVVSAIPGGEAVFLGAKGGKVLVNYIFSTDALNKAYYTLEADVLWEDAVTKALKTARNNYINNKTESNAKIYMSAIETFKDTVLIGFDYAEDLLEVASNSEANKTTNKWFGKYTECMSLINQVNSLKTTKWNNYGLFEDMVLRRYKQLYFPDYDSYKNLTSYQNVPITSIELSQKKEIQAGDEGYILDYIDVKANPDDYTEILYPTWSSSNENIIKFNTDYYGDCSGEFECLSEGTCTLTATQFPDIKASVTVTVGEGSNNSGHDYYSDFEYSISADQVWITKYNGSASHLIIPSTIEGYRVIGISQLAFYGCSRLTNITLPNTITTIRSNAFADCTELTSITIPDSVTDIGQWSFIGCTSLRNVTIGNNVTAIGERTFDGCISLRSIRIGNSVTSIGAQAFSNCRSLLSITIPDSVTKIERGAFEYCTKLTSIDIPSSVTDISNNNGNNGILHGCSSLSKISIPVNYSYNSFFGEVFGNTEYDGSIKTVQGDYSYYIYYLPKTLSTVKISGSGEIQQEYFKNCSNIESIIIGDGITGIEYGAFSNCKNLKNLTIGKNVKNISANLSDCDNIEKLSFSGTIDQWAQIDFGFNDYNPVYYTHNLFIESKNYFEESTIVLTDAPKIGRYAFYGFKNLEQVTLANNTNEIDFASFKECSSMKIITLSNTNISISSESFYNCNELQHILGDYCIKSIGANTFYNCVSLNEIKIGSMEYSESLGYIQSSSFHNCKNLKNVFIGNSIASIGEGVFSGCSNLTDITIGKNVKSIGYYQYGGYDAGHAVFYGCGNLRKVNYLGTIDDWAEIDFHVLSSPFVFGNNDICLYIKNKPVTGDSLNLSTATVINSGAFYNWKYISSITMPDSVISIGHGAFENCTNITSVTIPDGVTSIGNCAFFNCSGLSSIIIPNSVKEIGEFALPHPLVVLYLGSKEQWESIDIGDGNYNFSLHYNCKFIETISPDCVNKGYDLYYCSDCDDGLKINYTEALGHDFSAASVINPTCAERGYTLYKCLRCNHEYKDNYIEKIPHNFVEEVCTMCGKSEDECMESEHPYDSIQLLESMVVIHAEEEYQIKFAAGNIDIKSISYKTDDLNIAYTTSKGIVHALSAGSTEVHITINDNIDLVLYITVLPKESSLTEPSAIESSEPVVTESGTTEPTEPETINSIPVKTENPMQVLVEDVHINLKDFNQENELIFYPFSIENAVGEISYNLVSTEYEYFAVDKNTGALHINNNIKTGSYTIKVKIVATGNAFYKSKAVVKAINIYVKDNNEVPSASESTPDKPTEPTETQPVTDKPTEPVATEPTEPLTDKPTETNTTNPIATNPRPTENESTTPAVENPTVKKKANPVKVTVKTKTVKLKKIKKKVQKVKAITVKNAQGKVTYKLVKSGITKKIRKLVKINSKGVITIKRWKKAKKGTYIIKVKITAKGNTNYNLKTITKTVKIKIK